MHLCRKQYNLSHPTRRKSAHHSRNTYKRELAESLCKPLCAMRKICVNCQSVSNGLNQQTQPLEGAFVGVGSRRNEPKHDSRLTLRGLIK